MQEMAIMDASATNRQRDFETENPDGPEPQTGLSGFPGSNNSS
jgi:hypothetical protein